jgi:hypothetical protein
MSQRVDAQYRMDLEMRFTELFETRREYHFITKNSGDINYVTSDFTRAFNKLSTVLEEYYPGEKSRLLPVALAMIPQECRQQL